MTAPPTTRALKKALRRDIGHRLSALDAKTLAAESAQTHTTLLAFLADKFGSANASRPLQIGLYASMPQGELQTDALAHALFAINNTSISKGNGPKYSLWLPRVSPLQVPGCAPEMPRYPKQRDMLRFVHVPTRAAWDSLDPQGKYALREPPLSADASTDLFHTNTALDVLVVPGVAFALAPVKKNGRGISRLGHGAGYYDDFVHRYRGRHAGEAPLLVGVGVGVQLVEATVPGDASIPLEEHDEFLDAAIVAGKLYM